MLKVNDFEGLLNGLQFKVLMGHLTPNMQVGAGVEIGGGGYFT